MSLETQAADRALLIEDLKSDNAVLQNSVTYFPKAVDILVARLPDADVHYRLRVLLNQLGSTLMQYNLEANNDKASEIAPLMSQIESQVTALPTDPSASAQTALENIFRHVRAVLYFRPQVSEDIRAITSSPLGKAIETVALTYEDYHHQVSQVKNRYRLALYTATLILLIGSGYLIWNYRNAAHLQNINAQLSGLVAEKGGQVRLSQPPANKRQGKEVY